MRSEDLVRRGSPHPKLETSGDFVRLTRCINSRGCSDDKKTIDHLRFVDRTAPISNRGCTNRPRGTRIHAISCRQRVAEILVDPPALGASRVFFAIPPGPRRLDACAARMHDDWTSVYKRSGPERTECPSHEPKGHAARFP